MNLFSPESELLIKHWQAFQDIKSAEAKLNQELSRSLYNLESDLKKESWWSSDWYAVRYKTDQFFISNTNWRFGVNKEGAIWIGVENFSMMSLFGDAASPSCYVWVNDDVTFQDELTTEVKSLIYKGDPALIEKSDKQKGYILSSPINKVLPEQIGTFSELCLKPILNFMREYAGYTDQMTSLVKKHLKQ